MRKTTKHIVDEQEIMRFNLRRENENGKTYNAEEFKELLKAMGYTTSGNLITCMVKGDNPPFIRVERGKYAFNPKPVHIQRLQKVWDEYGAIGRKLKENHTIKMDIVTAIEVLKANGYKVLKPITQYEEV